MKYLKIAFAGLLTAISSCQAFIYGFLDLMFLWVVYSLGYLALNTRWMRPPGRRSQIVSLIYVLLPLSVLLCYAATAGLSHLTLTFYIVFMVVLALAFLWEVVSLCLVVKEKSDDKKRK